MGNIEVGEEKFIREILIHDENSEYISTLSLAIKSARYLSNRDIKTGELKDDPELVDEIEMFGSLKFSSLTHYLIIIDLIGSMFTVKGSQEIKKERFLQCLSQFSDLEEHQIDVLKNLRNSLAHNFSLGNDKYIFRLHLHNDISTIPIQGNVFLSRNRINGKKEENYTDVNYFQICNIVEGIYSMLFEKLKEGTLELNSCYKNNRVDFLSKYTIKY